MNDGGPAYPTTVIEIDQRGNTSAVRVHDGPSLRQWYKGQAIKGAARDFLAYVADRSAAGPTGAAYARMIADAAAILADAMVAEDAEHARQGHANAGPEETTG